MSIKQVQHIWTGLHYVLHVYGNWYSLCLCAFNLRHASVYVCVCVCVCNCVRCVCLWLCSGVDQEEKGVV